LRDRHYHSRGRGETAVGIDVGATLAKIAVQADAGEPSFRLLPAVALDEIAREVAALGPCGVGVTGAGAADLAERLVEPPQGVGEFDAWACGASALLVARGGIAEKRYLLVSLGTGTSILLVDCGRAKRVGGTALGGGTVLGLGMAILDTPGFDDLVRLASKGSRGAVDLLVSDIYRTGERPLPGDLTAASFGKLARPRDGSAPPSREDLARAVMGLVGENVALLCGWMAASSGASTIVFAGSTLRGNPALIEILSQVAGAFGCETLHLRDGEFAGALGALRLSQARADR
jgi:type II pantothenate kinase